MQEEKIDKVIELLEGLNSKLDKLIFIQTTNKSSNGQISENRSWPQEHIPGTKGRMLNRPEIPDVKRMIEEARNKAMTKIQNQIEGIPSMMREGE